MNWICEQHRRNVLAEATWELYAPHRRRVTQLLIAANSEPMGALCLLGAGNLNDVDLRELLIHFREIMLVDVDVAALQNGIARQRLADDERIRIVAPVDVTGIFASLSSLDRATPASGEFIDRCLRTLEHLPNLRLGKQFDVVGSIGLLTQLIESVVGSVGESHLHFWKIVEAVRRQHVRLLLELARPGGSMVLVTEVVSSDSLPDLLTTGEADLPRLLRQAIAAGNFFTGTNPAAWQHFVRTDPALQPRLANCQFEPPWLWQFVARTYAVMGIVLNLRP